MRRRILYVPAIIACLAGLGIAAAPASPSLAGPPNSPVLTAGPLPTWQTNGIVWAMEQVGGVVYVGGNFTAVRPPGSAPGHNEVPRKNLAAFNAATGQLLPFSHAFTAPVYSFDPETQRPDVSCTVNWTANTYTCDTVYEIRKSADGAKIYVGGDFVWVDGKDRRKLAAFSTANAQNSNNALDTGFRVFGTNYRVRSLAVTANAVYAGGMFTSTASGVERQHLAAYNPTNGALLNWAPRVDGRTSNGSVIAMIMSPDNSRVIVGGEFDRINGTSIHGLAAIDAVSGALTRWDTRPIPSNSYVTDLVVDQDTVYASSNGEGTFDGRLAANPYTGQLRWVDYCLGATWSLALLGDVLYSGSHAHNCSQTDGGFPEQAGSNNNPKRWYRLLAQSARSSQTTIQHWFPNTNGGDYSLPADRTPARLGPRTMTTDGQYLWVGGQFTTVNEKPQQSLTRFAYAPDTGAPTTPGTPRLEQPLLSSSVRIKWTGSYDRDDATLTYVVFRNGAEIGRVTRDSKPWSLPEMSFMDNNPPRRQTVTYQISALDPDGNSSARSAPASINVR